MRLSSIFEFRETATLRLQYAMSQLMAAAAHVEDPVVAMIGGTVHDAYKKKWVSKRVVSGSAHQPTLA